MTPQKAASLTYRNCLHFPTQCFVQIELLITDIIK